MSTRAVQRISVNYPVFPNVAALAPEDASLQLALYNIQAVNGSGGSMDVGICKTLNTFSLFKEAAGFTEITSAALSAGIAFLEANTDGIFIGSTEKFGLISLGVSDSQVGAATYAYEYFNGTSFVALNTFVSQILFDQAAGENKEVIAFAAPRDWAVQGDAALDADKFYIRIIATVATAGTPPSFDSLLLLELLSYRKGISQNGALELDMTDAKYPLLLNSGESIVPFFATEDAGNYVELTHQSV